MATSIATVALATLLTAPTHARSSAATPISAGAITISHAESFRRDHQSRRAPPEPRRVRPEPERLSRKQLRGSRTAVAVGGAIFGLFYLGGTLVAASNLDAIHEDGQVDPDERDRRRVSHLMFIPVVGPLVASPMADSKGDTAALVAHGVFQGLAVGALIGGAVGLARDRRARRFSLSAGWTPTGGQVALRGRF